MGMGRVSPRAASLPSDHSRPGRVGPTRNCRVQWTCPRNRHQPGATPCPPRKRKQRRGLRTVNAKGLWGRAAGQGDVVRRPREGEAREGAGPGWRRPECGAEEVGAARGASHGFPFPSSPCCFCEQVPAAPPPGPLCAPSTFPACVTLHQDARTTSSPIPLPEAVSAHRCQESLSFLL